MKTNNENMIYVCVNVYIMNVRLYNKMTVNILVL